MQNEEQNRVAPKVVRGEVSVKKKSRLKAFFDEDVPVLVDSAKEKAVPRILDGLFDLSVDIIGKLIFGIDSDDYDRGYYSRSGRTRRQNYTDYSRRSTSSRSYRREAGRVRSRYDVDEIGFKSSDDAYRVLDILCEELENYGFVAVGTYYSACDISPGAGDFNYGWYDLRNARVVHSGPEYVITMPRCVPRED